MTDVQPQRLRDDHQLTLGGDDRQKKKTKTCAEWVAQEGRGYLAGSVW